MAEMAGLRLRDRWAGWSREPFTSESREPRLGLGEARLAAAYTRAGPHRGSGSTTRTSPSSPHHPGRRGVGDAGGFERAFRRNRRDHGGDRVGRRRVQRGGAIAAASTRRPRPGRGGRGVGLAVPIALGRSVGLALRRAGDREPLADARAQREASPSPSAGATGPANIIGPASVEAGSGFQVQWTGPNRPTDYVTIVAAGTSAWTDESYFYTSAGSPGTLVAPVDAGPHVLWYVSGNDDSILDAGRDRGHAVPARSRRRPASSPAPRSRSAGRVQTARRTT